MRVRFPPHLPAWLAAVAVYSALALALCWPVLQAPGQMVIGAERSDVWNSLWSLWWVAESLARGELPLHTDMLDFPAGGRLLVADPVNTLLAAPAVLRWGPVATYNALICFHQVFSALAAHAFARTLGARGWIAGVGYGFSAMMLSHAHNGASEAISGGWLPLACLAAVAVARRGGVWRGMLAGLALFLCAAAGWYGGVGAWIFFCCLLLVGVGDGHSRWRRLALPAAIGLVCTLPLAWATRAVARAPDGLVVIKGAVDLARLRRTLGAADPRVFFFPGDFRSPDFRVLEGNPSDYAHLAYLGWLLILLVGLTPLLLMLRRQRGAAVADSPPDVPAGHSPGAGAASLLRPMPLLLLTLVLSLILAMGPVLVLDGFPLALADHALPLPYRALELLPGFDALSLLYRLAGVGSLCLAVAADFSVSRLSSGLSARTASLLAMAIAALVLAEVRLISPARELPAITRVKVLPALQALAAAPDGAVVNLPVTANRDYLYEQVLHRKPLAAGLNTGANREGLHVLSAFRHLADGETDPMALSGIARDAGIRYVVLHRNQLVADAFLPAVRVLREEYTLLAEDGGVRVYALW